MTFNLPCVLPATTPEEVDRRFELWHTLSDDEYEALGEPSINDYLGWTEKEYSLWFESGIIPKEA